MKPPSGTITGNGLYTIGHRSLNFSRCPFIHVHFNGNGPPYFNANTRNVTRVAIPSASYWMKVQSQRFISRAAATLLPVKQGDQFRCACPVAMAHGRRGVLYIVLRIVAVVETALSHKVGRMLRDKLSQQTQQLNFRVNRSERSRPRWQGRQKTYEHTPPAESTRQPSTKPRHALSYDEPEHQLNAQDFVRTSLIRAAILATRF